MESICTAVREALSGAVTQTILELIGSLFAGFRG